MKIKKFEDLPIWKLALELTKVIYDLTAQLKFSKDFVLRDQIRRAVISISSNIVEGFEKNNNNEFIRYLKISKGSVGEVRNQLLIALTIGYISQTQFDKTNQELEGLANQIGGFISYLEKCRSQGNFIKKKFVNPLIRNRIIKKSIAKILATLLIVSLNWTGLSTIGRTFAYFNDTENLPENIYQAGTLDFSAKGLGDFSLNLNPNNQAVRNVMVGSEGSLEFKHLVEASDLEGDLCDYLNIVAMFEGDEKYNGSLVDLSSEIVEVAGSTPNKNWNFKISFSGDENDISSLDGKACQFNFYFKAWQTNMDEYNEGFGFTDQEKAFTRVSLRVPHALAQDYVVLNEFLPKPLGNENLLKGIEGEWVELYNNHSDQSFDLSGWYIEDEANHQILITDDNTYNNSSVIGAKGSGNEWLVVFMDGAVLNNSGDTVELFDNNGNLVDSYSYGGSVPENKSYARYPDGTGPWYDPIPTPGGPNVLTQLEVSMPADLSMNFGIEESIEQNSEQENDLPEISIIDTATPYDQETIVEETIIGEEPIAEEVKAEEAPAIDETATIEEMLTVEEPIIEEAPVIEEQPVIAPPENNSAEQALPADNSGDGGDGSSGDAVLSE